MRGFFVLSTRVLALRPRERENTLRTNERDSSDAVDGIYPYETAQGTRYYFKFRDARGKSSTRRGFTSRRAAKRAREALRGKVHRGELRVSRATFGGYWRTWLARRRPFLQDGAWQDYRRHGELRLLPHLADERLTALTATGLTDWLVELAESGEWAL